MEIEKAWEIVERLPLRAYLQHEKNGQIAVSFRRLDGTRAHLTLRPYTPDEVREAWAIVGAYVEAEIARVEALPELVALRALEARAGLVRDPLRGLPSSPSAVYPAKPNAHGPRKTYAGKRVKPRRDRVAA
jgi:hypothetical protein